jgi:hypothetical protein
LRDFIIEAGNAAIQNEMDRQAGLTTAAWTIGNDTRRMLAGAASA